jgi:transcription elongation GreA/GreB family factor
MNNYLTEKEKKRLIRKKERLKEKARKLRKELGCTKIKSDDSNSDYIYECRELQNAQDEIFRIEEILEKAEIVEVRHSEKVVIGSCVVLDFGDAEFTYIVGVDDPEHHVLSTEAPLGKSILNKKPGDQVNYKVNGKELKVEIKDII